MTDKHLDDAAQDATVVRTLSRLASFTPSRGFAERVMARVGMPQPRPVTVYRRARAWASQPRHALALAGGYAASAVVALVVVVPWLLERLPEIGFAGQWMAARISGAAGEALLAAAGWAVSSGAADFIASLQLSGGRLWLAAGALTAGYAGCAFGLHFLLRTPRGKDVSLQIPV